MKKIGVFIATLLLSSVALATKIQPVSTDDLVHQADYVLVGTVKDVKLFNEKGKEKKWFGLRTGPGLDNTLYYYIDIDKARTLKGNRDAVPETYKAEIWKMWHKELKSERELYNGKQVVLFLKGNDLQPVSLSEYIHVISSPDTLVDIEKALGNTD